eukprot:c52347_g1_i1.p1 GENE.c52347_g1_i1~~c52347_g1_i1.p1  ORF type:complete len:309 (+),score=68.91 c52347_g1_i1:43-969(+)
MDLGALMNGEGGHQNPPNPDAPVVDTAEMVYISALPLIKMLRHGRAGVPMEVMGLLLGTFVDDYTISVVDAFAMPQSGTGVSVEAVDHVFQTEMLEMLAQTNRTQLVVGWYHSHPGFGCWLSSVDVNTQKSFEQLNERAVAVVVDPLQSVKGKVVVDCFRSIPQHAILSGREPRQTTANIGHLHRPSIQTLVQGLNRAYYSIAISYRKNAHEVQMLSNLRKRRWIDGMAVADFDRHASETEALLDDVCKLATAYTKAIQLEDTMSPEAFAIASVGKLDAKRHLEQDVEELISKSILQCLAAMLDVVAF